MVQYLCKFFTVQTCMVWFLRYDFISLFCIGDNPSRHINPGITTTDQRRNWYNSINDSIALHLLNVGMGATDIINVICSVFQRVVYTCM